MVETVFGSFLPILGTGSFTYAGNLLKLYFITMVTV
jgi:hypothetical protein